MDKKEYHQLEQQAQQEPHNFWAEQAQQNLDFFSFWQSVSSGTLEQGNIKWFEGATLNVCHNCLDRHLPQRANQVAFFWQGDNNEEKKTITYQLLYEEVCRFANVLKSQGVKRGDRICIYLPMIPEAIIAMLACARIGAVHSVVFAGFSPQALTGRITDAQCRLVVTADESIRGGRVTALKRNVDDALVNDQYVKSVIVVKRTGGKINWQDGRDYWYHELIDQASVKCVVEHMSSEDPLFILYTSGSTGQPKGIVHSTAGYLLYAALTHKIVFNYQPEDIYWCAADIGWITGHTYIVYGPLANGAISVLFEGIPTHPDAARAWQIVDTYQVNQFYTAPTAIRALMSAGDEYLKKTKRKSLKVLGSVGEPLNPEAWEWYYHKVGRGRCPIVDTWWQTETGGHMITPIPGVTELKPGSATHGFLGIMPGLVNEKGNLLSGEAEGRLVLCQSWPAIARTIYGDHARYMETYFKDCPGYYLTGDGARRDADGNYWITGRVDDAINVSGHLLGTAEIESALITHPDVAEAAVVGCPHPLKGQGVYAFVTLNTGVSPNDSLKKALNQTVRQQIGPIVSVDNLQWASALPKTRSGKIMRRILRQIAANEVDDFGDVSTLAEPEVVKQLVANRLIIK